LWLLPLWKTLPWLVRLVHPRWREVLHASPALHDLTRRRGRGRCWFRNVLITSVCTPIYRRHVQLVLCYYLLIDGLMGDSYVEVMN
jgi:hypothetical protein